MSMQFLSAEQIDALVGSRHPVVGFEYPPGGLQPYYHWLMSSLHLLAEASAGELRVGTDNQSPTHVHIVPGRAILDGQVYTFAGTVVDLAPFNNDVALVGLTVAGDLPTVIVRSEATGWPPSAHLPLAEVALSGGAVGRITDLRSTARLAGAAGARGLNLDSLATSLQALWPRYTLTLIQQGSVSTPSYIAIARVSASGEPLTGSHPVRLRVCDVDQWTPAAHATLEASGATAVVHVPTPGKDLVLLSDASGQMIVDLTNAHAETVTLRVGPAPAGGFAVDFSATLDVTHT